MRKSVRLFIQFPAKAASAHLGIVPALTKRMELKHFVYILRSDMEWHNTGPCRVTVHHRPRSVIVSLEFAGATTAARFERYLKIGSGRAFAKRHFGPSSAE